MLRRERLCDKNKERNSKKKRQRKKNVKKREEIIGMDGKKDEDEGTMRKGIGKEKGKRN